jgi:hypothetical protein
MKPVPFLSLAPLFLLLLVHPPPTHSFLDNTSPTDDSGQDGEDRAVPITVFHLYRFLEVFQSSLANTRSFSSSRCHEIIDRFSKGLRLVSLEVCRTNEDRSIAFVGGIFADAAGRRSAHQVTGLYEGGHWRAVRTQEDYVKARKIEMEEGLVRNGATGRPTEYAPEKLKLEETVREGRAEARELSQEMLQEADREPSVGMQEPVDAPDNTVDRKVLVSEERQGLSGEEQERARASQASSPSSAQVSAEAVPALLQVSAGVRTAKKAAAWHDHLRRSPSLPPLSLLQAREAERGPAGGPLEPSHQNCRIFVDLAASGKMALDVGVLGLPNRAAIFAVSAYCWCLATPNDSIANKLRGAAVARVAALSQGRILSTDKIYSEFVAAYHEASCNCPPAPVPAFDSVFSVPFEAMATEPGKFPRQCPPQYTLNRLFGSCTGCRPEEDMPYLCAPCRNF